MQAFVLPRFRVVHGSEIAFGPGKARLLALVAETGSIGEAARRMDMSYMRAWSLCRTMNRAFSSPLIETVRGGNDRGGAQLTATGRRVLELYHRMEQKGLKVVQTDWRRLQKLLRE